MNFEQTFQWKAHDSVILTAAWSSKSNLMASGSEDCHYKIWDPRGQLLFNSITQVHPISSISWSSDGTCCAFASFSTICITNSFGVCLRVRHRFSCVEFRILFRILSVSTR